MSAEYLDDSFHWVRDGKALEDMAALIAQRNPDAVRAAKRVLNQSSLVDVATGLAAEATAMQGLLGTPNQLEAIAAKFEDRSPQFRD